MSEGSLKVFLDFRRRVASIMREHDAVRINVLRPALAVVGVLGRGTSTYACARAGCTEIRRYMKKKKKLASSRFKLRQLTVYLTSVRRSVIVQCSRGLRGGGCEGWSRLRGWPWGCGTRCRPYGTRATRLTLRDASAGSAELDTSCFQ